MITTVTLNPAIDRTVIVDDYRIGDVNRVSESHEDVGGKGINISKVLHLFNQHTVTTGLFGGENGEKIKKYLSQMGIEEDFVDTGINTRMNIKIMDTKGGTITELNEKGKVVPRVYIEKLEENIKYYADRSEFLVFSGSAPEDFDLEIYQHMIEMAQQYTKVVVDADGEMLKKGVRASPFLIKPNIHELRNTFQIKTESLEDMIYEVRQLIEEHHMTMVLVSMGKDGSVLITKDRVLRALPVGIVPKSTVGAGDSLLGGFLYQYGKNQNPIEALRYGAASGTAAAMTEGTKVFTKESFEKVLHQTEVIQMEINNSK